MPPTIGSLWIENRGPAHVWKVARITNNPGNRSCSIYLEKRDPDAPFDGKDVGFRRQVDLGWFALKAVEA